MTDVDEFVAELRRTSGFNFCTPEGWCLSPGHMYSTCFYFGESADNQCRWRTMIRDPNSVSIPHCTCSEALLDTKIEEL